MNINSMRDADADIGFYFAACPTAPDALWGGTVIYESRDSGATFQSIVSTDNPAPLGFVNNALGTYPGGNTVDELNFIDVTLRWGSLTSTDYAGLLSGVNACVVGSEIIYFRNVTQIGDQRFRLTGLLRGRRGSEHAMTGHISSERFVFYSPAAWARYLPDASTIGLALQFRAATIGYPMEASQVKTLTNQGNGAKPYAPAHLGGGRNAAGDITLTWARRTRIGGDWANLIDVPLAETSEAYEVEIYNSSAYTTVVRFIAGLSSQSATYLASDQVADFGSVRTTLYFRIYQMSSVIGRGYAATGQV